MRVTHAEDHVTHAVIGAGDTHAFQINDSTEFFRILSSSLYSNKKLAVIREILCNAWDAHIEAGLVDMPIEVILSDDKLSIRDLGSGMSKANILKLYTTYGGTSKIDNEAVTGGFGLGSKAPFAYVDHFEVISHYQGTKTIYNMSLSSAQVDGKPSVMALMDLPTDESGIQVSLNLKDSRDYDEFERIIQRVARNGEMQVKLNGEVLKIIPFSQAPHGFTILPNDLAGGAASQIYIRYGHVVYPLDRDPQLAALMDSAQAFMRTITDRYHETWGVVLQACPGSVSVTPSRESLSMTDRTLLTVKQLLAKFNNHVREGINADCIELTREAIAWGITNKKHPARLLTYEKARPSVEFFKQLAPTLSKTITEIRQAAAHYMCSVDYPKIPRFQLQDMMLRLKELEDRQWGDVKLISSYRHALQRLGTKGAKTDWLQRKIFWPLTSGIKDHPTMKLANLYVTDDGRDRRYNRVLKHHPIMGYRIPYLREAIPFLRKLVIISHNRTDVLEEAHSYELIKEMGSIKKSLTYIVPRQSAKIADAIRFFESHGYQIVDMTPDQTIEKPVEENGTPVVRKPRRIGVPKLSNLLNEYDRLVVSHGYRDDCELVQTPAFACIINPQRDSVDTIEGFCSSVSKEIVKLFGEDGAMVVNRIQLEKIREKGAVTPREWILPRILAEFKKNKLIQKHYRNYRPSDIDLASDELDILSLIRRDDKLRRAWKLPEKLPEREKMFVKIFESFDRWDRRNIPEIKAIVDLQETWTASPAFKRVSAKIQDNPVMEAMHYYQLRNLMKSTRPEIVNKARQLILLCMKG